MSLPIPLPDNPKRWDGWRNYNSDDLYERLCLSFESNPSNEQIEENCRQLLIWWQKKLPLKNQPSNPLTQMLRAGLDEAPHYLAEARSKLLNIEIRDEIDRRLREQVREKALDELYKFLSFATADGVLTESDEQNLCNVGIAAGLAIEELKPILDEELIKRGVEREKKEEPPPPAPVESPAPVVAGAPGAPQSPFDEFRRMVRLSGLSDDDMTDDQRDALCNMGENLGLTGGQAEDLIDEYLEEVSGIPMMPPGSAVGRPPVTPLKPAIKPLAKLGGPAKPQVTEEPKRILHAEPAINISPLARAREREKHPNFSVPLGLEFFLVPSGMFHMGSDAPDAAPNEQPVTRVTLECFYMSRFPVTNAQFEQFDPSHRNRRAPWADDRHPVVYVSSEEAEKFCKWLSAKERREFRLPTEAEWEYAARGIDGRLFPWGDKLTRGDLANLADANTTFTWRDPAINDGFAQSSPVGSFPRGASPFGMEDMAGNVWEWCQDYFEAYKGKDRVNPHGPTHGTKRMYRGGSWKSRASNLRASARAFNLPNFSANDVGFRVVCLCH